MSADTSRKKFNLLIVAGEVSGDQHAAKLVQALQETESKFEIRGMGMQAMQDAGVHLISDASETAVTGLIEIIRHYPKIRRRMKQLQAELRKHPPDLLILVDYPGFNLVLAKFARRLGIKVLYYISPKIWAWNYRRIRKIARRIDMMAVIFPFEVQIYREHRIPVRHVGHPLIDEAYAEKVLPYSNSHASRPHTIRRILLLPGSRPTEIHQHLPLLSAAAKLLKRERPELTFSVLIAPGIEQKDMQKIIAANGLDCTFDKDFYQAAKQADFAIAASGTVTLQLALCRVPMIIIYKVKRLTYWIATRLVKTHIGLPNILTGRLSVKELVHYQLSAEQICRTVLEEINSPKTLEAMHAAFTDISAQLGSQGSSERLAGLVCEMLSWKQPLPPPTKR